MPERELEQVMLDFYRQRFNVLVCTTIIESGIDMPSANTIIINRADRFGLAQLHQLRGRVGRSHHRAYAYLVVPDRTRDDGRCREAARSAGFAGRAGCRLHAGHARSRNPRCRRTARRRTVRPDRGDRFRAVHRTARARRARAEDRQGARLRSHQRARDRSRAAPARADSRRLSARRAHAPDAVQAHRQRARRGCTCATCRSK